MAAATAENPRPRTLFQTLVRLQNPFMKWLLRSPLHFMVSSAYTVITFTGRKSGMIYSTPIQYGQAGSTVWAVTNGTYRWWRNLRGGAPVSLRLRGHDVRGQATISEDPAQVASALAIIYPKVAPERFAGMKQEMVAVRIEL